MKDEIKEILDNLSKEENYIQHSYCRLFNYEANILLDYITNLQEENKRLKEQNKMTDEQIEKAFEVVSEHIYKSRIDKAIEYINEMCLCSDGYASYGDDLNPEHIVNILKGGDDNV